nr:DUF2200 domain-containing protein [Flavobacterium davisii]
MEVDTIICWLTGYN